MALDARSLGSPQEGCREQKSHQVQSPRHQRRRPSVSFWAPLRGSLTKYSPPACPWSLCWVVLPPRGPVPRERLEVDLGKPRSGSCFGRCLETLSRGSPPHSQQRDRSDQRSWSRAPLAPCGPTWKSIRWRKGFREKPRSLKKRRSKRLRASPITQMVLGVLDR